jgi:hypothetical protein
VLHMPSPTHTHAKSLAKTTTDILTPPPPPRADGLLLYCSCAADAAVDKLGTVLRLLYIRDLRGLQTTIDRMLVQAQVRVCFKECMFIL